MNKHYIVVLAASAGGLKALNEILSNLPKDFPAPLAVVQHLNPHYRSMLAQILNNHTPLLVKQAEDGDILCSGTVYVAPPDKHLLVNVDGSLSLSTGDKVRHVRPAADVLFISAANNFQGIAIAVVLSGMDKDGAVGVEAVKKKGGIAIAQSSDTSEFSSMPNAAINTGCVDYILPLDAIAPMLLQLVNS